MVIFGFNQDSLKRHNVTERECLEALADEQEVDDGESRDGNPTVMWLGMTMAGRLLEVGVEYLPSMDWVYHADDARSHYRKRYKGRRGR
jgi:hypothetical protein